MSKQDKAIVANYLRAVIDKAQKNDCRVVTLPGPHTLCKKLGLTRTGPRQIGHMVDLLLGEELSPINEEGMYEDSDLMVGMWSRIDFDTSLTVLVQIRPDDKFLVTADMNGAVLEDDDQRIVTQEEFLDVEPFPDEGDYSIRPMTDEEVEQAKTAIKEEYEEAMCKADNARQAMLALEQFKK